MFRPMRRSRQAMNAEECAAVFKRGTSGVLALSGDDGYPYAVPMSYVYDGGKLYFHCAKEGHKLDAIRRSGKASFCVIDQDEVIPDEYTTNYRSVIVFGQIRVMEDGPVKDTAIMALAKKYSPELGEENYRSTIEQSRNSLCMLEMTIDHISGKMGSGLVKTK